MKQLETHIQNLQYEAFHHCLGRSLTLLAILVLRGFLCLVVLVIVAPAHLIYYVSPTLSRLLAQMVFKGKFALFRFGRIESGHDKVKTEADRLYREVYLNDNITDFIT